MLTFVLGHALGAAAEASLTRKLGQDGGDGAALLRERMAGAREIAARFPRLRARLDTAGAGYGASPEDSFEFGLQVILDGLQDRLASRRWRICRRRPACCWCTARWSSRPAGT
jgi:hypothetical protein